MWGFREEPETLQEILFIDASGFHGEAISAIFAESCFAFFKNCETIFDVNSKLLSMS